MSEKTDKIVEQPAELVKVRITMTSTKVRELEEVCDGIIRRSKGLNLKLQGPKRMPTKVLTVTTRKTPNGEGSKTWDAYEMRIHKRVVDVTSHLDDLRRISAFEVKSDVNMVFNVAE